MPSFANGLIWAFVVAFAALSVGTGIRAVALRNAPEPVSRKRLDSLLVWWVLTILFAASLLLGKLGLAILFCLAGLLALREFHTLFARRSFDSPVLAWAVGVLGIGHYALLVSSTSMWSMWALPPAVLVMLSFIEIAMGRTKDYLRATAGYSWAFVLMILGLSYVVALVDLPAPAGALTTGSVGWCIFLVVLTELNDIAQALIGRRLGRHRIAPVISSGKTWEGFLGGALVTIFLAIWLSPVLTSLTVGRSLAQGVLISAAAGALIALGGFLGDLNMSALKREAGVKDSSNLLPGMGGMIDRIDSLTVTAPAFYYFAINVI